MTASPVRDEQQSRTPLAHEVSTARHSNARKTRGWHAANSHRAATGSRSTPGRTITTKRVLGVGETIPRLAGSHRTVRYRTERWEPAIYHRSKVQKVES